MKRVRFRIIQVVCLGVLAASIASTSQAPALLNLNGDIEGVHDPAIIKENRTYYLFSTGGRPGEGILPIRCSDDLHHWRVCGNVFAQLPGWVREEIPRARGAWAPDISFFRGRYHLYYAVSTFGSNESVIGLATNETLDSKEARYRWVDEGPVVASHKSDDWNAIDPNLFIESKRKMWLVWGSFWSGIKMRRIDAANGKLSSQDTTLYALASRPRTPAIRGSIEAPFLMRRNAYWYLFVSFDFCCRGVESTYNVVVGRARAITGPYVDRENKPMTAGGGTPVVPANSDRWHGAGHAAVFHDGGRDYLLFHAYDSETGRPRLEISTMNWAGGWPHIATLQ